MKKYLLSAFAIVALLCIACGGDDDPTTIPVMGIKLDKTTLSIGIGDKATVSATITPSDATNKSITWSSANPTIATVSNGVVSGVATGETTITAKTNDGGYTATVSVEVVSSTIAVTGISLDATALNLEIGEKATVVATVEPEDATNKSVVWSSADKSIATVEDGVVEAIAAGETTITAKTEDGEFTASVPITVAAPPVAATGVKLDKSSLNLEIGEKATVVATVEPEDATNKSVVWSSADESIATVEDGVVEGVATGETTITAKTNDGGFTATIPVKVVNEKIPVTGIEWQNTSSNVKVGKMAYFVAMISPENATDMSTIWESDNPEVASIGEIITGDNFVLAKITGVAPGKATISVTTNDGGFKRYCPITIDPIVKVTEINISPTSTEIEAGQTEQLTAAVLPSDAENKKIEWSSSDTSVATVDANGLVTGVAKGEATITATAKDGSGVKATAEVEVVSVEPTSATVNGSNSLNLLAWHGKKIEVTPVMTPAGADLTKLNWTWIEGNGYNPVIHTLQPTKVTFESPLQHYPYQFESMGGGVAYNSAGNAEYILNIRVRFRTKCMISTKIGADGALSSNYNNTALQIAQDSGGALQKMPSLTRVAGTHYFEAFCPPLDQSCGADATIYYPDAYIPTTEYTLTSSDSTKWKVTRLNDRVYMIEDLDTTTYKEIILTYTCGDFSFDYKFKVTPL